MWGDIPVGLLDSIGIAGMMLLVFIMLSSGRLVTRREADNLRADKDEWRTAHRDSEKARAEMTGQVDELLEHARLTDAFIRALPHVVGPSDDVRERR